MLVDSILVAAEQLSRAGVESWTTNHVAERAGVSIGSIYQYFPSKESLSGSSSGRAFNRELALDCDDEDILNVSTTYNGSDTVLNNTIVNLWAGPFQRITMTCDGDTEMRYCNGATAEIDRLRSDVDEYRFTCWE